VHQTNQTYSQQSTLLWGAGAVGLLSGWATSVLVSVLKGTTSGVRYYPENRPSTGTDNYVHSRIEGTVGNIDLSPASVTPPGVGQKIGSDYDYQYGSKGQAEFKPKKSAPESLDETLDVNNEISVEENPERLDDQPGNEPELATGRDELSEDEVWANMGEDFYKSETPSVKPKKTSPGKTGKSK
jgi:hypothetical protein